MKPYRPNALTNKLWSEAERAARAKSGPQVIRALATASDRVWIAGLDHAFEATRGRATLDARAPLFDAIWLAFFVEELRK